MAEVCKWLGFYLCMRNSPQTDAIGGKDLQTYDAVIVWKESPNGKTGGMAYEVMLKPAIIDAPKRPLSPPKERFTSKEEIIQKLKEAEERRRSAELTKLQQVAKSKERAQEAARKAEELNSSFSREAEKKLNNKLEVTEKNKNEQLKALRERLNAHAARVAAVRQASEHYNSELKNRIHRKLEVSQEKRDQQMKVIQERLREHEKHIQDVLEVNKQFSKATEQKLIQKMEATLKNRENQLQQLTERLKEHEKHVHEVRQKKPVNGATSPTNTNGNTSNGCLDEEATG